MTSLELEYLQEQGESQQDERANEIDDGKRYFLIDIHYRVFFNCTEFRIGPT